MQKLHERTLARRMAVQALYISLVTDIGVGELLEPDCELPDEGHLPAYAKTLIAGADAHAEEIDALLAEASENWSVERMPVVDHAILLLSCYEMFYEESVPVSVVINEAVELAKLFGGEDDSARFVNGLLGRIARTYCSDRIADKGADDVPEVVTEA
ncbi:MAG: transcription antitermination factor NusB [Eggerthellaceae bacterium]|nr:transcription antitermination factor NusB [Eggerthellaceae bacterium]